MDVGRRRVVARPFSPGRQPWLFYTALRLSAVTDAHAQIPEGWRYVSPGCNPGQRWPRRCPGSPDGAARTAVSRDAPMGLDGHNLPALPGLAPWAVIGTSLRDCRKSLWNMLMRRKWVERQGRHPQVMSFSGRRSPLRGDVARRLGAASPPTGLGFSLISEPRSLHPWLHDRAPAGAVIPYPKRTLRFSFQTKLRCSVRCDFLLRVTAVIALFCCLSNNSDQALGENPLTASPVTQGLQQRAATPITPPGEKWTRRTGATPLPPRESTSPNSYAPSAVVGSLALVLALFFIATFLWRRATPSGSGLLPPEVVQVLGRAPLAGRQQMHLIRCGHKLLLVSISAAGAETLTEITDPTEVDRLAGVCQQARPESATSTFRHVFQQLGRDGSVRDGDRFERPLPAA